MNHAILTIKAMLEADTATEEDIEPVFELPPFLAPRPLMAPPAAPIESIAPPGIIHPDPGQYEIQQQIQHFMKK